MHIAFTVINDLTYDQRMQRICSSLAEAGFNVTLIGRELPNSSPLKPRDFKQIRLKVPVHKGKLFYLLYNIRIFFHLLFNQYDVFSATDLDTLLPQFLVAKIKRKPHVYDAHEYFAQLPEIIHRPLVAKAWKSLERWIIPKTKYAYTINQSYANLFEEEYGVYFNIFRNVTKLQPLPTPLPPKKETYILYQGAVNVGRGVEEMIAAMPYINCQLYVCGKGDVYNDCVALVKKLNIAHKVRFLGFVEPERLRAVTREATLGFTFFTNDGMSYYYSLANRFFDYFHNGVPQLCINFPEYAAINQQYEIACLINDLSPQTIANAANKLLNNKQYYQHLQQNCLIARQHINWQQEAARLVAFYRKIDNSIKIK